MAPERIDYGASNAAFEGLGEAWGLSAPSEFLHKLSLSIDALNAKWNDWVLGYGPENQQNFMEWLGMDDPNWRKMMLTLIAVVVGLVMLISLLLMLRYRPPAMDDAAILYQRFVRKTGLEPIVGETAIEFERRARELSTVPREAAASITEAYLDARYGPYRDPAYERLKVAVGSVV